MTGTGANMRASLTVTADASDVVIEARRGAEAWREFRREVSAPVTSQATNTDPAATMRQDMAERAATANRILAESLNPVLTAERALAQEQQALTRTLSDASPAGAAVGQALDTLAGGADRASASSQRATETLREMRRAADEAAEASARAATRTVSTSAAVAPVQADAHVSLWQEAEVRRSEEVSRAWRALESSLDPLTRATRELASAQELVNAARTRGLATDAKASRALAELDARYQKLIASQRLGPSGDDFHRAVAEDERAVRQLMLALDPAARAQQEFAQAQELVTRAVARGTITQDEAARTMQQLEARQQAVGRAGTSMGLGIQNASYQFTDMIVQLQSGQSAAIALGQQLPQLLGGFGALGAVLGLAAAAGVPLIAMLFDAGEASKSLDDHLQDLETRLGSISDRLKILRDDRLGETFGSMSGDVRALTRDLLALDRAAELKSLQNSLDKLLTEKTQESWGQAFWRSFAVGMAASGDPNPMAGLMSEDLKKQNVIKNYADLTGGRGPSYEQFDARRSSIVDLAKAGEVEKVVNEVRSLVQSFAQGGPVTDLNDDLREMLDKLGQAAIQTAEVEANLNLSAQATKLWSGVVESTGSYWDRVRAAGEDIRKDGEDRIRIAENELSLAQVIARTGEDSKQAEAERDRIARENYELELKRAGLFGDQRDRLLEIWDQHNRVTDATAAWADTMGDVRSEIDGIVKAIASIGGGLVERAAKAAELKALQAGGTIADAAAAGQKTRRDAQYNARAASLGGGLVGRMVAGAEKWWGEGGDELDAALSAARSDARKRDRSSAGAGNRALNSAASIKAELAKLKPSYEADVAAAEAWRDKALAGLKKASTGYEEFAADVETIFREKLAKAYEADLERRTDWAAGVERAQLKLEKDMKDWADFSDDVMTRWAKSGEDAFAKFVTTGKASLGDFVDFVGEQFARLAYQQMIQPGLNSLMSLATSSIASAFNIQLPGAAAAVSTNHTGSPGVSRSYSIAGYGDSMRQGEQLTMMRQGEEIMTSRALENAGAMISALSALASKSSAGAQMAPQPNVTVITQTSTPMQVDQQETVDAQGNRQQQFVISEIVADGLGAPGGAARRRLTSDYGLKRRGIRR